MAVDTHLLLLPGSLCDEAIWEPQMAALGGRWSVNVPHMAGLNSIAAMAAAALNDAPAQFSLAGFSMGGRVALEMMRLAPDRIERLALLDSSVHPVASGETGRRQELIDLAFSEGMEAVARVWLPRLVHPARRDDAALMSRLTEMTCRFTAQDYADEVHALLNRPDPQPVLGAIRCPTLVLSGRQDPLSTPERNSDIAGRIATAELVILDDCGHFPQLEASEATSEALERWLKRS